MTSLTSLWLPILLSGVLVFVASSIIHMVIGWHRADYPPLPDEALFADTIRPLDLPPGDYFIPCPRSSADARSPEFLEKRKRGPVMMMTVFPAGETDSAARSLSRNIVESFMKRPSPVHHGRSLAQAPAATPPAPATAATSPCRPGLPGFRQSLPAKTLPENAT